MQYLSRGLLFVIMAGIVLPTHSATIAVSNVSNWTYSLPTNITNAGEYYPSILENELPTTASISIRDLNPSDTWTLNASTTTTDVAVAIKPITGGSTSGGSLNNTDLDSYTTLTLAERPILHGTGSWESIPLLFKISNLDVTDGYGDKNLPIQYSLTTP